MKNGTVLLVGIGAVAVTAGAVYLASKRTSQAAPGSIPQGSPKPGKDDVWSGLFGVLTTLGGKAIDTYGAHGSQKPTTPQDVGDFNASTRPSFLMA